MFTVFTPVNVPKQKESFWVRDENDNMFCSNNLYILSCCEKYYSKVLKRFSFCFEIEKSSKIAVFKLLCFESVVTQYQNILKKITIFESPLRLYHVFNSRSRKLRDIHQFSNMTLQGLSIVLGILKNSHELFEHVISCNS